MGRIVLVSYAGARHDAALHARLLQSQKAVNASATGAGIDTIISWDREQLEATAFYRENQQILDLPRGGGYWLWKPYVILQALRVAHSNDVILYTDVGKGRPFAFTRPVAPLVRWCREHNGILPGIPILPQSHWTKRDCFHFMDCDSDRFWNTPQIQATFSLWSGSAAQQFVSGWLTACRDARCLTDGPNTCGLPNLPGFVEHRHDQSVLTNLCRMLNIAAPVAPALPFGFWTKKINLWSDLLAAREQKVADVERTLQIVLAHEPRLPYALHRHGLHCVRTGRTEQGFEFLRQAAAALSNAPDIQLDFDSARLEHGNAPRDSAAHFKLAFQYQSQRRFADAIREYECALRLNPRNAVGWNNYGNLWAMRHEPSKAEHCFRAAIAIHPRGVEAHSNLGLSLARRGRTEEAIECLRRAIRLDPESPAIHSNLLLVSNSESRADENLLSEHVEWAQRHAARHYPARNAFRIDRSNGRLRVGYISPDFRRHPVSFFLEPILRRHDRSRFEIFCYNDVKRPDDRTLAMRDLPDHWRDTRPLSDDALARQIIDDRIDILVDLCGHMGGHRLLVFARRVAPIQVTYLGYPNTTGVATMDYRITDALADPSGMTEHHYAEKLIRLPGCFLCYVVPPAASDLPDTKDRSSGITFGCFNHFGKVAPPMLHAWAEILLATPGAQIFLKADGLGDETMQADVLSFFERFGVDRARVQLMARMRALRDHMDAYRRVDIALDTFPYNGTTTTCEALWMGVPVVSLAGASHRSRVGATLLAQVGLSDFVAGKIEDYVSLAVDLARDEGRLSRIGRELRQRMLASPIMDSRTFVGHLEHAYTQMVEGCETS